MSPVLSCNQTKHEYKGKTKNTKQGFSYNTTATDPPKPEINHQSCVPTFSSEPANKTVVYKIGDTVD